jgi:predicted RNA binding protein YcfA (HicA-like mRNA interferase family)
MDKYKLLEKIKNSPNNTRLDEFEKCIKKFGFVFDRQKGSHKIYVRNDIQEFVNIQSRKGKAKPEQISEFVKIVNKYKL